VTSSQANTVNIGRARETVSSPDEPLILVDSEDRVTGYDSKAAIHRGSGALHRAFSVFLFDHESRVLLHKRSALKPLWPGFWTNSCCSHPRRGESLEGAVHRRLREELGVSVSELLHCYRFEYHAHFLDRGSEHELCHVFLARLGQGQQLAVHEDEIAAVRWELPQAVDRLLVEAPASLTPWFRMEWLSLRGEHAGQLEAFLQGRAAGPRSAA
jgi:isopentenyl-diphosphate delta-isomerase